MRISGHRRNMLNGEFCHSGCGVATRADGRIYFTQVFLDPA
jgi:uncharacterized protein YkwD